MFEVEAKSAEADHREQADSPRDAAAECGEAAATLFKTHRGPRRAVRHSGSCRSRFWTTGSAIRELTIMYSSSILFFPISSSSFPTAYSLPVYLVPVPVYSAEITACLLKGKQKQANPTGQWTSFVLSVPLFFGHLHPARSNQRTYIPCLFPAHVQTVADKYNIFTTAAFLVISIPITQ